MSDFLGVTLTIGFVLVFLVISEILAKKGLLSKENARKLIHISVGNVIFFLPLFETRLIAAAIPFTFIFGNYLLSPKSPIRKAQISTFQAGHAWGTVFYPISLTIIVFLKFDQLSIVAASFLPLVYGDGFAAVFGPLTNKGRFKIYQSEKTLLGTSIVSLFSWVSVLVGVQLLGYNLELAILFACIVGILAPFIELLSPTGTDNLVLPLSLLAIFSLLNNHIIDAVNMISSVSFGIGLLLGLLFAIGSYVAKALTDDGAITGFMITIYMLGLGGLTVGVQLFLFFVIGTFATKIGARTAHKTQAEFEKGTQTRDAVQGIAKAGLPSILSLLLVIQPSLITFYILTGVMTTSLVDTMATEIGIATNSTPVKVLKPWVKAKKGENGVVSLYGTLGGMLFGISFSLVIKLVSIIDPFLLIPPLQWHVLLVFPVAGLVGMLTDSVLGVTLQRRNLCEVCSTVVEASFHHNQKAEHTTGLAWFNNDMTNFFGTFTGGIISLIFGLILL